MDPLADRLADLGLSRTEAEVYLALLRANEATATQAAKGAGVPRPAVYAPLASLVGRGLVEVFPVRPQRYRAKDPAAALGALVEGRKRELEEAHGALAGSLARLYAAPAAEEPQVWLNKGLLPCATKWAEVLGRAREDAIALLGWCAREEAQVVLGALREAARRGVTLHAYLVDNTVFSGQVPSSELRALAAEAEGARVLSPSFALPFSPPVKLLVVDDTDVAVVAGEFEGERLVDVVSIHYHHLGTLNRMARRVHASLDRLPLARLWGL